jgi:putative transposase
MQIQFELLTDTQYSIICNLLDDTRKRKHDLRTILDMIFYVNRTGCQWRNLRFVFPKWQIVYYYFNKFSKSGLWEKISQALVVEDRKKIEKNATPSLVSIDSQSVKSVQFVAKSVGNDGNKQLNGRKRNIIVDTLGNILCVLVCAANIYDGIIGMALWDKFYGNTKTVEKILADGTYRGQFTEHILKHGCKIEISSRPPTERGFVPIKKRWVVERSFSWFNFYRRLDKEREKNPQNSEAMIYIAQIQTLLYRNY